MCLRMDIATFPLIMILGDLLLWSNNIMLQMLCASSSIIWIFSYHLSNDFFLFVGIRCLTLFNMMLTSATVDIYYCISYDFSILGMNYSMKLINEILGKMLLKNYYCGLSMYVFIP